MVNIVRKKLRFVFLFSAILLQACSAPPIPATAEPLITSDPIDAPPPTNPPDPKVRPPFPTDYCNESNSQGPTEPPTPFLYQPFEGIFNGDAWASQMDHDQPIYIPNGTLAALGEILDPHISGPGLVGGTQVYVKPQSYKWFEPDISYKSVLQQGYRVLAYQSPSYEDYFYYDGHDGHDFAITGRALASAHGNVVFVGNYGNTLGRVVEIDHLNGYLTRYAHLAGFADGLQVGSSINVGEPVGTIGRSAVVNGVINDEYWGRHLHFSVFRWTGSEWHITDPFGWDPWAGPDQESRLRKQKEDPLVNCNGEISYNQWVGEWPHPYGSTENVNSFHPTQDRYVGGWLGDLPESPLSDPTSTVTSTSIPTETPTILPTPTSTHELVSSLRGTVTQQSSCRYGPSQYHLYKTGFRPQAPVKIIGRDADGDWLQIELSGGNTPCWMNADLIQVEGNIMALPDAYPPDRRLQWSDAFPQIGLISASPGANGVIASWVHHEIREDLRQTDTVEYIIEVWTCVDGKPAFYAVGTDETVATFQVDNSCGIASYAHLIGQDEHGFSFPTKVPVP